MPSELAKPASIYMFNVMLSMQGMYNIAAELGLIPEGDGRDTKLQGGIFLCGMGSTSNLTALCCSPLHVIDWLQS